MGRALIVSAGASSNEYIAARLTEMGYSRPVISGLSNWAILSARFS